ncbi:MAG: hypothetical protein DYG98_27035 [Haliscomenobacteraceae bacterium CHB4]|nr:hypothetical protein [Haliscomenobacteraceae bacterium CHB4]
MHHSSLLETLSAFNAGELEEFHRFVHSPFFNDGPHARDCIALWECLRPYAPAFSDAALEAKHVYVRVFPGKSYVKGKLEVVMSKLHQLAKQYAATITATGFVAPEPLRLASFFRQRGLPRRAAPLLEKLRAGQMDQAVHDAAWWYERFFTESEQHLLDTDLNNHHNHEHLAESIRCLHLAHLTQSLQLLNTLFYARRKSNVEDELAEILAEALPEALRLADLGQEPLLRLLKTGFDFARKPEQYGEAELRAFWHDLEAEAERLPADVLRNLFGYARNHCTWQFNHGKPEFAALNLDLFKSCFGRGLLFDKEKIQAATYLNMVQAGLIARDFDWLDAVMPQCRDRIVGVPAPAELYNYTRANCHYHRQEYDRALDLLRDASDDLYNNLMARKLELKIYYETNSPLLDSKIENFKLFIFRQGTKRLPEDVYRMNNTFIDLLRKINNIATSGQKARVAKLIEQLDADALVAERLWLRSQLEKII